MSIWIEAFKASSIKEISYIDMAAMTANAVPEGATGEFFELHRSA